MKTRHTALAALALATIAGCATGSSSNNSGGFLPGQVDGGGFIPDAGPVDGGPSTADVADSGPTDSGPIDAGPVDGGAANPDVADSKACESTCEPEGGVRCVPDQRGKTAVPAIQRCADPEGDGCYAWSEPKACDQGEICHEGACAPKCPDQDCTVVGATKCGPTGEVLRCHDFNGDGCLAWGGAKKCPGTQVCAGGFCALSCKDECTTAGAKKCEGNGIATCGDSNKDGCLEWGQPASCGKQVCSAGFCEDSCKDECTVKGAKRG